MAYTTVLDKRQLMTRTGSIKRQRGYWQWVTINNLKTAGNREREGIQTFPLSL